MPSPRGMGRSSAVAAALGFFFFLLFAAASSSPPNICRKNRLRSASSANTSLCLNPTGALLLGCCSLSCSCWSSSVAVGSNRSSSVASSLLSFRSAVISGEGAGRGGAVAMVPGEDTEAHVLCRFGRRLRICPSSVNYRLPWLHGQA